jgi:hypothetical protein
MICYDYCSPCLQTTVVFIFDRDYDLLFETPTRLKIDLVYRPKWTVTSWLKTRLC